MARPNDITCRLLRSTAGDVAGRPPSDQPGTGNPCRRPLPGGTPRAARSPAPRPPPPQPRPISLEAELGPAPVPALGVVLDGVPRLQADPLREWPVLLLLLREDPLDLEGLLGRLRGGGKRSSVSVSFSLFVPWPSRPGASDATPPRPPPPRATPREPEDQAEGGGGSREEQGGAGRSRPRPPSPPTPTLSPPSSLSLPQPRPRPPEFCPARGGRGREGWRRGRAGGVVGGGGGGPPPGPSSWSLPGQAPPLAPDPAWSQTDTPGDRSGRWTATARPAQWPGRAGRRRRRCGS